MDDSLSAILNRNGNEAAMSNLRRPESAVIFLILAMTLGGCVKDACEQRNAEAQIDIKVSGINKSSIDNVVVGVSINNEKVRTLTFLKPEPSFVLNLWEKNFDKEPYLIRVLAYAKDKEHKLIGFGDVGEYYSFDGCNHIVVTMKPKSVPDGGVDSIQPDISRMDIDVVDQRIVDSTEIQDLTVKDGPGPDTGIDLAQYPDLGNSDLNTLDKSVGLDMIPPDVNVSDLVPFADSSQLDKSLPDIPYSDSSVPDISLKSDTGTLSCTSMDTIGVGLCSMLLGYKWDGTTCQAITGCSCSGSDCGKLYKTNVDCQNAYTHCKQWKTMTSPFSGTLRSIWGTSDTNVFAVGNSGTILHYDGKSWKKQSSGTGAHLTGVWAKSVNDVYTVGFMDISITPPKLTFLGIREQLTSSMVTIGSARC